MEFKGTKGKWNRYTASVPSIERPTKHSVYADTQRIALCYDLFESDESKNVKEQESEYNALLISKAPEMLEMLQIIYQQVDFSFSNFGNDTGLKMEERIKQLIKEATEL